MISIIVPAFNEEAGIGNFIQGLLRGVKLKEPYELVLVNDGSTDRTMQVMGAFSKKNPRIRIVSYTPNKGLGHALRTGMRSSRGRIIVTMDSDAAHPPKDIHRLVAAVDKGFGTAIGSRYAKGGSIEGVPATRVFLSRLTNLVMRLATLMNIKDMTNGFRAYRADILPDSHARGFEVEIELLIRLRKAGARIVEVPVAAPAEREAGTSKFKIFRHGTTYAIGLARIFAYRWLGA